ncbi:hypothetical protein N7532_010235 [Penicillium argentinense]|uniref:Uncharacterized protein n=1 Tax=Penicillium argentinense TaxID=1131581 RepID=A0A9W9EPK0_9EURO|nr:uncharacterized protein N7532_010235 [Penicillium argentinense]KAJ5085464.1 hypothetical protein N7532_010235 [Penicillium argentinense]
MRFHTVAILTGATAVSAGNTANLLLPGFQGKDLQCGVQGSSGDATTYLVTCPTSVAASDCGIPGNGLTAIAAPTSVQLINPDGKGNTASVSCNVGGTTSASCVAQEGTVTVSHTLGSKDLNWMPVTITTPTPTSTPTSTSTPTPTPCTSTSTITPTSTSTPVSSPVKSTTRVASSTRLATSSIPVKGTDSAITGTPAPTGSASSTPPAAPNAAAPMSGNAWTLGGAVLALVYALA